MGSQGKSPFAPQKFGRRVAFRRRHRHYPQSGWVVRPDWAGWPKATRAESIRFRSLKIVTRHERPAVVSVSVAARCRMVSTLVAGATPPGAAHADRPPEATRVFRPVLPASLP